MRCVDILRISYLGAKKGALRTALTIVATAIGVASVLIVITLGLTTQRLVTDELDNIGVSGALVYPKKVNSDSGLYISEDDAAKVMSHVKGIGNVMPLSIRYSSYKIKNWQGNAVVYCVDETLGIALNLNLLHGRLPAAYDVRGSRPVVVVDSEFAQMIYGHTNIVGKILRLNIDKEYDEFEIIGVVMTQSGGLSSIIGSQLPTFMYIPYTTANEITGECSVEQLLISGNGDTSDEDAAKSAALYLDRKKETNSGFSYDDIGSIRSRIQKVVSIFALFIGIIGGISIIVAGIGVMNTMLSTTSERKKEIGVYMSLGSRTKDIILCYLTESGMISAFGGICGICFVCLISAVSKYFLGISLLNGINGLFIVLISEFGVTLLGMLFGIFPAVLASRLDPIEVLRSI